MHVEVHDKRARGEPFDLHRAHRDRRVVEHAETLAMGAMRMMGAAREVHAAAGRQRAAAGRDRRAGGAARALDHRR